jgi:DNA modification methylase
VQPVRARQSAVLSARQDVDFAANEMGSENWDFAGEDTQYLLHDLHPYPARFIPQIPRRCIARWSLPGDLVLDPFCGSGTTLLEAKLAGRNSIGVDNNGVATLVARAKVLDYSDASLAALASLAREVKTVAPSHAPSTHLTIDQAGLGPQYEGREKWFDPAAVGELAWLRNRIRALPGDAAILGMAVFSGLVVRASRQDSDTRYVATARVFEPGSVVRSWAAKTLRAAERARETVSQSRPSTHTILTQDSKRLPTLDAESVDLVVTSPPYLNAYDYHKYHRHRLHWIDADISLARDAEIGKHDTFTRKGATPDGYFRDLTGCLEEWTRVLRGGGHAAVVVGDAIVSGKFVAVGDAMAVLGQSSGLSLEGRWIRTVDPNRKSFNREARIKREHVLVFRKPE